MSKRTASSDIQSVPESLSVEDVLKGAVVVGGIALGLLILKSLLEGAKNED